MGRWQSSPAAALRPDPEARGRAYEHFRRAIAAGLEGAAEIALGAATNFARHAFRVGEWPRVVEAAESGTEALARLSTRQQMARSKRSWFDEASELPLLHAAALHQLGRDSEAIDALERGRARLLADAVGRRSADLLLLEREQPDACRRIEELLAELRIQEWADPVDWLPAADAVASPSSARSVKAVRRELDQLVREVRERPGFEEFLQLPAPGDARLASSQDEPLVYVAAGPAQGLAFVCAGREVESLVLDGVTIQQVEHFLTGEGTAGKEGFLGLLLGLRAGSERMGELLAWLGEAIAVPLADALRRRGGVRRVNLVLVGQLGLLPLHAAPLRRPGGAPAACLLDEFDISYAPSARVLTAARGKAEPASPGWSLVGLYDPWPSHPPLDYTAIELGWAALRHRRSTTLLTGSSATRRALLDAIGEATVVQLACHGHFVPQAPLESALILGGGSQLRARDLLVGEAGRRFRNVRLVILSACGSALTEFTRSPDEVLGLPFGFLQAGVPGVIGTLWPVNDLDTALLMGRFHDFLAGGESGVIHPATALRQAQLWLRDVTVSELLELLEKLRKEASGQDSRKVKSLLSKVSERFAQRLPSDQPFSDKPGSWAPFVYIGA